MSDMHPRPPGRGEADAPAIERSRGVDVVRMNLRLGGGIPSLLARGAAGTGDSPVVLDLSRVEYITSTAIGELVWLSRQRPVVLAAPSASLRRILDLAEVSALLEIAPTVEDGIRLLAPDPMPQVSESRTR